MNQIHHPKPMYNIKNQEKNEMYHKQLNWGNAVQTKFTLKNQKGELQIKNRQSNYIHYELPKNDLLQTKNSFYHKNQMTYYEPK